MLVDRVSQHPEQLKLGGELRELTLMFCDIRGFTKISESLDPQALTQLMNSFLTPMTRLIQDREGTIDKYIGDCIMAFWNAPVDVDHHAEKAILAALDMRAGLKQLNEAMAAAATADKPAIEIKIGIGLNSGTGCVGNMGSEQRFNYSVLGDAVNIASRLEALSPSYGVDLVVGEETAESAPELALLELDRVRVKGKILPVQNLYMRRGSRPCRQFGLPEAQGSPGQYAGPLSCQGMGPGGGRAGRVPGAGPCLPARLLRPLCQANRRLSCRSAARQLGWCL